MAKRNEDIQTVIEPHIPIEIGGQAPAEITPKPIMIGDGVFYHEGRGDHPALVQHVYPDGSLRLWVFGAQSIHPKDGIIEGTEIGTWSRKS